MKNVILLLILLSFTILPCHSTAIITGTVTNFKSRIVSIDQNRVANSTAPVYYGDRFQSEIINNCTGELYYVLDDKGNIIRNNGSEVIDTID